MSPQLTDAFAALPSRLAGHVALSASALALGLAFSLPLAVAAARSPKVRWPALALASLVQTIPSLALLALFYPVLLALSAVTRQLAGFGLPALGFLPSRLCLHGHAHTRSGVALTAGSVRSQANRRDGRHARRPPSNPTPPRPAPPASHTEPLRAGRVPS
jgi:ABC-type proline/glycine betaine transport system permease subunit